MRLIVAVDENWGIGYKGTLLAHLPGDLKYFKEKTTGKGIGESTQKYLYLPESHTDFIFPIIVEEWGFIVGVIIIFLYLIIFIGFIFSLSFRRYIYFFIYFSFSSFICFSIFYNIYIK